MSDRAVPAPAAVRWREPQTAAVELRLGKRVRLAARVEVTPHGLLAIGGLVGMILLGSAAIVRQARAAR